jgi:hypothetical protein
VASITDALTGADTTSVAVPSIESAAPIKGNYSARFTAAPSYLEESFPSADALYMSFYVRVDSLPAGDVRLALVTNNGVDIADLQLRSSGQLRLRWLTEPSATVVGLSTALTPGTVYRIGLHQQAGTGANAVLAAYLATGDAAFGAPFASIANGTWTDGATRVRIGAATTLAMSGVIDDVRIDSASMPGGAPPSAPNTPTGLAATAPSTSSVQLTWTDTSNNETAFIIERAVGAGSFSELATLGANAVSYTDNTVSASTQYSYRIRAANSGGFSAYSNVATATTPAPPSSTPNPPTGLSANAPSSSSVQLSWTDASTDETSFRVERGIGGNYTEIASLPAGTTSYTDNGVAPSTAYTYRVRAHNVAGFSAYSNVASVTTPGDTGSIKVMTFEGGSLAGDQGAQTAPGLNIALTTTDPIKGTASAAFTGGSSYLQEQFDGAPAQELYTSFYLKISALPTSDVQLAVIANGSGVFTNVGEIQLRSSGQLRMRVNGSVISPLHPALSLNTVYRIGLIQKAGTGGNAVVQAFVAEGDAPFVAPFASLTNGAWTDGATRVRIGAGSAVGLTGVIDDVKLHRTAMPGPSN